MRGGWDCGDDDNGDAGDGVIAVADALKGKLDVVRQGAFQCPAKDGQYEDPKQCDKFYDCDGGVPTEKLCPDGLVFDPTIRKQNKCDQPFNVDCGDRIELQKLKDGFECPKDAQADGNGQAVAHPKFAHPEDCQKFYVCLNGVEPRELGCSLGEVYNEEDQKCDAPENVAGCEDWYKDSPEVGAKGGKPKKQRK
ncbi:Uncharacterized protein GBIM_15671 [Gryllus bimaculatus]|nr:Uncharacterized protein GBIM_15671 [Gryllus bimaculatus]